MVWVISGREAFSPQMLKNYRYEPEIAFILMGNNEKSSIIDAFPELSRLKNVLTVLDERDTELISKWSKAGMLYAVSDSAGGNSTAGISCRSRFVFAFSTEQSIYPAVFVTQHLPCGKNA